MATSWMRAALASSSVLLRASRSGRVLHTRTPLSTLRFASTAAQPQVQLGEKETTAEPSTNENSSGTLGDEQATFQSLDGKVSKETLGTIKSVFKITNLSPVQAAVLPLLPEIAEPYDPSRTSPRGLLVKAKTGTGKTLAFLIPVVEARMKALHNAGKKAVEDAGLKSDHHLELRARRTLARSDAGALIISPTRELATQIANEALRLTSRHDNFEVRLFVGGASKRLQMRDWMRGRRDIVVGTPGRIRDLLENEPEVAKGMQNTPFLVLDEADTLLEMGFREDIEAIASFLPKTPQRQTFLFSATVSREIRQVARSTLDKNHTFIDCVPADDSPVHAHVPQYHTVLPSAADQIPHIVRLLAHDQLIHPGCSKTIIFLPTTKMTQLFSTFIRQLTDMCLPAGRRTSVYEIHSKRTMEARTHTSNRFRADRGDSILISSDVSARGVDYPGVTRVIQVGIPGNADQYVHRVGRTGRGRDKVGRADLVLLPWEFGFVTWQLNDIALKPLSTNTLVDQIKELAQESNPTYAENLDVIPAEVKSLMEKLDPEAVKETLASLLGYYLGKSGELRCQKSVIVEGLKQWTVEACGLPQAPYISQSFLEKLGVSDGRTKAFGMPREAARARFNSGPAWTQRGNVSKNRERMTDERRSQPYGDRPQRSSFGVSRRDDGERPSYQRRDDGERPSYQRRDDGERPSYQRRDDGERSSYQRRDDGERPSYQRRDDGGRPSYGRRNDGERSSYGQRGDGERPSYGRRREDSQRSSNEDSD